MATIQQVLAAALKHHQAGELQKAGRAYKQILSVDPNSADALHYLGILESQTGNGQVAIDLLCRAIAVRPRSAVYQYNLGTILHELGRLDEAVACYRRALKINPADVDAHHNLGSVLQVLGRLDEAEISYLRVVQIMPGHSEAHFNLGVVLQEQGRPHQAEASYRRSLQIQPENAKVHRNLGLALSEQGKLDEAVTSYRRALELSPDFATAHNDLGNALKDLGQLEEAIASYRRAVDCAPHLIGAHSNLLHVSYLHPGYDANMIYDEHRRWNAMHAEPLAQFIQPHSNDRSLDRPLRIGYVSPDLRDHPVGRFILPVFESHNHEDFTIWCYASVTLPDETTERCRESADVWRNVLGRSDEQVARLIREDRIDILVDLSMHMLRNRLLTFARKPAPIQVTYLAYCGTTGLNTIDYRLTDPYLDSDGEDKEYYSEKSVHLPETYWCYRPIVAAPDVRPPPLLQTDGVTFGCLNNIGKVNAATLETWGRLLCAVPGGRLLIHAPPSPRRDRVLCDFATNHGISPDRITFVGGVPVAQYFRLYDEIDIALDPFPWGGGTTTCDALWMGVPVVSLAGQTAVGRGGLSILSNIGLPDLVARDADEYVSLAARLAGDRERLCDLRKTLRARMLASPLMDAERFTRNLETAYRNMWHRWCAG